MPIPVVDIWDAVTGDINISESGQFNKDNFTDYLNRTQINLLRFLTGDLIINKDFPMPWETQKNKDYLKLFIKRQPFNNNFTIPEDYYKFEHLYKLGRVLSNSDCQVDDIDIDDSCDKKIELLDSQKLRNRCNHWIKAMRPSEGKPIAEIIDNRFETMPKDIGTMALIYIRYPKPVKLVMTIDPNTQEEIVDAAASGSVEWDLWAKEYLIWGVVNYYSKRVREGALKQFNNADQPKA